MIRVGFHVEGVTDLEVLRVFTERILSDSVEPLFRPGRMGGHGRVVATVHAACWDFWREDARAAVLHIDNNSRPRHEETHAPREESKREKACRRCLLLAGIPVLPERPSGPLRLAMAVPVPATEAWLIAADDELIRRHPQPEDLDRHQAKRLLYRVSDLSQLTRDRVLARSLPLARGGDLAVIRSACPSFDRFVPEVEAWRA